MLQHAIFEAGSQNSSHQSIVAPFPVCKWMNLSQDGGIVKAKQL